MLLINVCYRKDRIDGYGGVLVVVNNMFIR